MLEFQGPLAEHRSRKSNGHPLIYPDGYPVLNFECSIPHQGYIKPKHNWAKKHPRGPLSPHAVLRNLRQVGSERASNSKASLLFMPIPNSTYEGSKYELEVVFPYVPLSGGGDSTSCSLRVVGDH